MEQSFRVNKSQVFKNRGSKDSLLGICSQPNRPQQHLGKAGRVEILHSIRPVGENTSQYRRWAGTSQYRRWAGTLQYSSWAGISSTEGGQVLHSTGGGQVLLSTGGGQVLLSKEEGWYLSVQEVVRYFAVQEVTTSIVAATQVADFVTCKLPQF